MKQSVLGQIDGDSIGVRVAKMPFSKGSECLALYGTSKTHKKGKLLGWLTDTPSGPEFEVVSYVDMAAPGK